EATIKRSTVSRNVNDEGIPGLDALRQRGDGHIQSISRCFAIERESDIYVPVMPRASTLHCVSEGPGVAHGERQRWSTLEAPRGDIGVPGVPIIVDTDS